MSWLARSIANSLKFNEDDDGDSQSGGKSESSRREEGESKEDGESSPTSPSHGVKEDLSELSRTLTRQFRGFASFLAPPPQGEEKSETDVAGSDAGPALGIRGDFSEIGGRFRSGITRLSKNINVSEITKMASSLLQMESDDENRDKRKDYNSRGGGPVGVTEEVVAFASDIASHPDTWLDFPLPDGDDDDFDMSDEQQEHALAVERLVPSLAALRMELCPRYISDDRFWRVYFVLVHTRLLKEDALILSTPQVMETRAFLASKSKNRNTVKIDESLELKEGNTKSQHEEFLSVPSSVSAKTALEKSPESNTAPATSELPEQAVKKIEQPALSSDAIKKGGDIKADGIQEQKYNASRLVADEDEEDVDEWLKDETTEIEGTISKSIPVDNDDDVSFSDLEEEDGDAQTSFRKSNYSSDDKDTRDWVQLGKSSSQSSNAKLSDTKEPNDWLDVDDMIVP